VKLEIGRFPPPELPGSGSKGRKPFGLLSVETPLAVTAWYCKLKELR